MSAIAKFCFEAVSVDQIIVIQYFQGDIFLLTQYRTAFPLLFMVEGFQKTQSAFLFEFGLAP